MNNLEELTADAIHTLRCFHEAAALAGFPWYLHAGTLLGAVRDGDFCPGDADDIDIAVMDEDFDRVSSITDGGLWFREMGRFIFKESVEGVKLELHDSKVHIDVSRMRWTKDHSELYDVGTLAIDGRKTYLVNVYPGKHFKGYPPYEVTSFQGIPCRVPRYPGELLEFRYGPEWRTPIHRDNFDWTKKIPCPAIVTDHEALR